MKMNKLKAILLSIPILLSGYNAEACTGAKQIGAGVTGISTADNSHATYWNQAILPTLKQPEISHTHLVGEARDTVRYDNVFNIAIPLNKTVGIGIQHIDSNVRNNVDGVWKRYVGNTLVKQSPINSKVTEKQKWLKLGFGTKIAKINNWDISIGGAVTQRKINKNQTKEFVGYNNDGSDKITTIEDERNFLSYDASLLITKKINDNDSLRFGAQLQGQNNLRPGISYTKDGLTLAVDLYNFDNMITKSDTSAKGEMIGIEQKVGNFSLRTGYYNLNKYKHWTIGAGYEKNNIGVNFALTEKKWGLIELFLKF